MLTRVPERPAPAAARQVQARLGDGDQVEERIAELRSEVDTKLTALGEGGITKPKQCLDFLHNLSYKKLGGQQLTGNCPFCNRFINSTGASRVVAHFMECALCFKDVKEQCAKLTKESDTKRASKREHKS